VLEIDFIKADLRKLLRLTDANRDGMISIQEFFSMINTPPQKFYDQDSDINDDLDNLDDQFSEQQQINDIDEQINEVASGIEES
jgi:Ca2+-binding EF-hand superfamily protein